MLGPYGSGLTKAVAPITEKFKVPMVEANGAARELFTQGYKYIFAVLSTSDYYLRDAIKLAAEQAEAAGKDPSEVTVAIAVENDPFSLDVRDGVIEDAEKYGMQVVIDDKLPPELNDMSATLTKVKALKPDVLVVSAHEKGPLARDPADAGDARRRADAGPDPLRLRPGRRTDGRGGGVRAVRLAVGRLARL